MYTSPDLIKPNRGEKGQSSINLPPCIHALEMLNELVTRDSKGILPKLKSIFE